MTADWPEPESLAELERQNADLRAKLASLPVIEQAKGILMARQGVTPEEAFDMLKRASQRSGVKLRDLAAQIVAEAVKKPEENREE